MREGVAVRALFAARKASSCSSTRLQFAHLHALCRGLQSVSRSRWRCTTRNPAIVRVQRRVRARAQGASVLLQRSGPDATEFRSLNGCCAAGHLDRARQSATRGLLSVSARNVVECAGRLIEAGRGILQMTQRASGADRWLQHTDAAGGSDRDAPENLDRSLAPARGDSSRGGGLRVPGRARRSKDAGDLRRAGLAGSGDRRTPAGPRCEWRVRVLLYPPGLEFISALFGCACTQTSSPYRCRSRA